MPTQHGVNQHKSGLLLYRLHESDALMQPSEASSRLPVCQLLKSQGSFEHPQRVNMKRNERKTPTCATEYNQLLQGLSWLED